MKVRVSRSPNGFLFPSSTPKYVDVASHWDNSNMYSEGL